MVSRLEPTGGTCRLEQRARKSQLEQTEDRQVGGIGNKQARAESGDQQTGADNGDQCFNTQVHQ